MKPKDILTDKEAVVKLKSGIDKITNTIKLTLGPRGRTVLMQNTGVGPTATKDGATVSRSIDLEDPVEQMGAMLIKEAATKTESNVGDGTTSSSILTQAILNEGINAVNSGASPILLSRGIKEAAKEISENLEEFKQEVSSDEQLKNVAHIAANDEEVGNVVAEIFSKIGKDGVAVVEDSQQPGISYDIVDGLQIDKGYVSPFLVTDPEKMEAVGEDYLVFLTRERLVLEGDMQPIMEVAYKQMSERGAKGLFLIAEDIERTALAMIVLNGDKIPVIAVKAPAFGDRRQEIMNDIGVLTGSTVFTMEGREGKKDVRPEDFGIAKRVVSQKSRTIIKGYEDRKEQIKNYVNNLKKELEDAIAEFDREKLQQRIAKLDSGVATINVGAYTESEAKEIRYRVEDAIGAVQSAIEEGTLPGGGVALFRASLKLDTSKDGGDVAYGKDIVKRACMQPLKTLIENAGGSTNETIEKIKNHKDFSWGYNAETGKMSDLVKDGVLDTLKVVRSALNNSTSIASLLLTTGATVSFREENENK